MRKAKVIKTLRNGSLRLELKAYGDGRFGFDAKTGPHQWQQIRLNSASEAEARAKEMLGSAEAGTLDLLKIDPDEYVEFLKWKAQQKPQWPVPCAVDAFLESKHGKGRSMKHIRGMQYTLETFAETFAGPIGGLTRDAVESWLNNRKVGPRRWNNLLADIVALVRFARRSGMIGPEITQVEQIERKSIEVHVATYTPDEMTALLGACVPEWVPTLALQAFSGLRPEEVCPEKDTAKLGLQWSAILWDRRKVDVPATVSKTRRRRFAVLTDAAFAFLEDYRVNTGPVAGPKRFWHYLRELKRKSGVEWKPDALRHSFASYRLALTNDVPALALEMGNSPTMIHRHYISLKHEDEAQKWFDLRPETHTRSYSKHRKPA